MNPSPAPLCAAHSCQEQGKHPHELVGRAAAPLPPDYEDLGPYMFNTPDGPEEWEGTRRERGYFCDHHNDQWQETLAKMEAEHNDPEYQRLHAEAIRELKRRRRERGSTS